MQEFLHQTADAGDFLLDSGCRRLSIRQQMQETLDQTADASVSLSSIGVYWRFDCYLLCCAMVTKVFIKHFLVVDYNLEYLELGDPLD